MTYSHLSENAQSMADAPDDERIRYINQRVFIPYQRARELLDEMEDLLVHPKTNRMPNLLIVARSNNGKTEILKEFLKRHPPEDRITSDRIYAPVIYIQSPPGPSEDVFLHKALQALWAPVRISDSSARKLNQLIDLLDRIEVKMLLIDELNALLAGSLTKQRFFMNMLKYIGNELKIPIVTSGTREALQALATDEQLKSRFPMRALPRWKWGKDFRRLLASFEHILPLKEPSHLSDIHLGKYLYGTCEGVIGGLATVLRSAAEEAISSGEERIDEEIIKKCKAVVRESELNVEEI
ncbi:MAG: TniB family NTP-binding protein [Candidatus Thiodiazotropha taylori]|nr:TniB family NTP-binding protein [Candidatus Thiodiazotropha taylori]MCW4227057.1 TniB family NTP-binding protein [Candidatus Thiodiazotropha endolucinida]MCG7881578.1 TniB family NTP-binding protein [Candidatus Thiodiazotropha taylori]MCG7888616.1 TniB family NTP-binding protein [Candidatus Thiodiazotropha taylori]MCG8034062.1 TniB family NTP-binding protein [Candidatus Thiodiazotropha taylori]